MNGHERGSRTEAVRDGQKGKEREERHKTCVIKAKKSSSRKLLSACKGKGAVLQGGDSHTVCFKGTPASVILVKVTVVAWHLTVVLGFVLTRVGPDCGSVQPLYRLTSCVSMLAKSHAKTCRQSQHNKPQSRNAIQEEL